MFNVNEQDTLSDLLMQEKDIIKVYGEFLPEGSSVKLREILQRNLDTVAKQQFEVFEMMQSRGYYETKEAKQMDIDEAKKSFSKNSKKS